MLKENKQKNPTKTNLIYGQGLQVAVSNPNVHQLR